MDGKTNVSNALEDILDYFGLKPDKIPPDIMEPEAQMEYVLAKSGLMLRKVTLSGEWWKDGAIPLLLFGKEGEVQALLPDRLGRYYYYEKEQQVHVTKKSAQGFNNVAYCIYNSLPKGETGMGVFWRFLLKTLSRSDIMMICGISILLELTGLIMPYINSLVYDTVIPSGSAREIPGIVVLVVSSVIFSTLIGLSRTTWVTRLGNKFETAAQSAVWNRLFSLRVGFFKEYDSGELYRRATAVDQICEVLGGRMIPSAMTALLSVVYLFQISFFAQELVLPSVMIVALLLLNIGIVCAMQIRYSRERNRVSNRVTSVMYQLLGGITKIRLAGAEVRAFHIWSDTYKDTPVLPALYLQIAPAIGKAISVGGCIILYLIAYGSNLSASAYIAFQTAFSAFAMAVMALADLGSQFGNLKPAVDMLRPILDEQPEDGGVKERVADLNGAIEVSSVKFRYSEDMPWVLDSLSLNIKAGEYLGIVGSSGCGKSTLMRILLGFETAQTGTVYYDGKDVASLDLPSLRRRIGTVLQNGKLFSGDIYSNIVITAPWLTIDDAWEAAEKAGFADDVRNMPMGMFTMLSEEDGGLSGGQKQRLLIARALAADPDIMLFDEATSALDNLTQSKVVDTLRGMKCTRIVIAHRLSTIKDCDRIIYLEQGRIVEEGNYESLMEKNGKFASMAKRQLV